MIIEEFVRDEANEIYAVVAGEKIHLTSEYVAAHKPQIGDTLVEDTVEVEETVEETVEVEVKASAKKAKSK